MQVTEHTVSFKITVPSGVVSLPCSSRTLLDSALIYNCNKQTSLKTKNIILGHVMSLSDRAVLLVSGIDSPSWRQWTASGTTLQWNYVTFAEHWTQVNSLTFPKIQSLFTGLWLYCCIYEISHIKLFVTQSLINCLKWSEDCKFENDKTLGVWSLKKWAHQTP